MAQEVKAEIKNGNIVITLPAITKNCPLSPTGKSRRVASSEGNVVTTLMVEGKPVYIGLNAYIKP